MKLTADLLHGFVKSCLHARFDNPKPIPLFHHEMWDYCCSDNPMVAIAAPRGHAKSTGVSLAYLLAATLFRANDYILLLSDTEVQAIQFLNDIKGELLENDNISRLFGTVKLLKDNERDIICSIGPDKHKFRITARSSGTPIRGLKWRNKRPNLVIGDDLENDEMVMNLERREKFRNWFFSAVIPALSDNGLIRIIGTILHFDSFLARLMPPVYGDGSEFTVSEPLKIYSKEQHPAWHSILFRAHPSIDDFSQILWPEKFSEARLKAIRNRFIKQGFSEGYAQEYLNNPLDESTAFFKREDFVPMEQEHFKNYNLFYAGADFALSQDQRADYTVYIIAGQDDQGFVNVYDVRRGRWQADKILKEGFEVQNTYRPEFFATEDALLDASLMQIFQREMRNTDSPIINFEVLPARGKDKRAKARALQAMMRAKKVRFNKEASWYPELEMEMLRFDRGEHDDQVDALANIFRALTNMADTPNTKQLKEMEYEELLTESEVHGIGRSGTTGY